MNRLQTKSRVRTNLDQHNYFSEVDLNDSIQDGYDEIVVSTGCIENVMELDLAPNIVYYNIASMVNNYFYTVRIFSYTLGTYLEETDIRRLDRIRPDWELWRDTPTLWFPHSYERIAIVPAPRETQRVVVFYKGTATQVTTEAENFNIPMEGQYLPENFTTADMLEQCQEFAKAQIFTSQYQKDLKKTLKLMNRALPDQLVKLEG